MNLIANCCISGYLYQFNKEEFKNPFIWCFITPNDLFKMILNFDNINWQNINLSLSHEHPDSVVCKVDDCINLKFIHYLYDPTISFKQKNHNVKSQKIIEYASEKYFSRLKRMNESPVFLYLDKTHAAYPDDAKDFIRLPTNYKKILITSDKNLLQYNNENQLIIYDDGIRQTDGHWPYDYAKKYKDIILPFIVK